MSEVIKNIGALPPAPQVNDDSKIPIEQQETAMHVTGEQFKGFAEESVKPYSTLAEESAESARADAVSAKISAEIADGAKNSAVSVQESVTQMLGDVADYSATAEESASEAVENAEKAKNAKETAEGMVDEVTNDISDIKAYLGYVDDPDTVGLQVDFENNVFTRLTYGDSETVDFDALPMYGGRKRCNVLNDGTITAYYDGEGFVEDGTNGQVMVYQPAFWYKVAPIKMDKNTETNIGYHLRKVNYFVSAKPKAGFKLHPAFYDENGDPVDYILLSAYEGSMWDDSAQKYVNDSKDESIAYASGDLLCSLAEQKPISGLRNGMGTKANYEAMAKNRGMGWHIDTIKSVSANQLLMMIELGMMNTQTGIGVNGNGVVSIKDTDSYNCSSLTGSTSELGNASGSAKETTNEIGGNRTTETENGKVSVSYRGVENPWGNIWKHVNGINIWGNGEMGGGQVYIADDFVFSEGKHDDNYQATGLTLPNGSGFVGAMGYGRKEYDWLFMPSKLEGTNALPVGDFFYATEKLSGDKIVELGGQWSIGSYAGGFLWTCNNNVGTKGRTIGCRLLYVPTANKKGEE